MLEDPANLEAWKALFSNPEFWKLASIPFVAAVVGWVTNWVAIKLTFRPLEFVGIRPIFGWQGIIPAKARKMAEIFVDSTMYRLGTLPELFARMEPEVVSDHITRVMDGRLRGFTDEIMFLEAPTLWRATPTVVKHRIYARVRETMPQLVDQLMEELTQNVEEVIDFKEMIAGQLERDKELLNRLFLEAGEKEFKFLIRSGLYFGFPFGLLQLGVWIFHREVWVLPVFGLLVGWATNWIAINLIFRPLHPVTIGRHRIQGLFLQRQKEVAAAWCRLVTSEIVTVQRFSDQMLRGPRSELAHRLIREHIRPVVDEVIGVIKPVARLTLGADALQRIEASAAEKAVEVSADPFDDWAFNEDRARLVERLLRERMESMPPDEFQDLLRPCFQEDELKLILVGAALGFAAGLAQLIFVFGGL
ncbi:MAG: hypothetical protein AAGD01_03735 [Acidobacteriota bacterium]